LIDNNVILHGNSKIHHILKHIELTGFMKLVYLTTFFLTVHSIAYSQLFLFKGIIKDEQTLKPVQDVNIRVYGTAIGTSTDKAGSFSLTLKKTPAELIFTCIGYEMATYEITKISEKTVEFMLRPKSYMLQEIDISAKQYSFLFKDKDYSVFDYKLMDDKILLLIFRYQLKKSELVLINRSGDTLAISNLPEIPPALLFKDFLGNVHYLSQSNNSYQCFYNEQNSRIDFFPKTPVDSLYAFVKPFIFKIADRLYFQEKIVSGFGTAFGLYEKGIGKKYIRKFLNEIKISDSIDDQKFYQSWNKFLGNGNILAPDDIESDLAFDFSRSDLEGGLFGKNEARANQFEFYKMIYPVIKTSDENIAFFNFATDTLELMDKNGKIKNTVPITFQKEFKSTTDTTNTIKLSNSDWRWGSTIIIDDYFREVYTIFLRNGMVKVQKVDLETGKLKNGTVLPFPFPEKITIYKGYAYFLVKSDGSNDKWKLVKCKI